MSGISEADRALRKEKNIVSTQVNFAVWMLEVTCPYYSLYNQLFTIVCWMLARSCPNNQPSCPYLHLAPPDMSPSSYPICWQHRGLQREKTKTTVCLEECVVQGFIIGG